MDGPMPSGLPVDPHQGFWKGGAIAQLTKPVLIDETRPIDETRHDEIGCDRRHPAGGSPGHVGFPIVFGGGFLSDTYPDVL